MYWNVAQCDNQKNFDVHLLFTTMRNLQINDTLSGYVQKSQGLTITLSQIRYQHSGFPWQINEKK